jgi:hypothetical protein
MFNIFSGVDLVFLVAGENGPFTVDEFPLVCTPLLAEDAFWPQ